MRRFEFVEGKSSKFWEVAVVGASVELRWGRIGTKGQSKTKPFDTPKRALAEVEKLVAKKLKDGYRETTGEPAPTGEVSTTGVSAGGGDASNAPAASPTDRGATKVNGNPEVISCLAQLRELAARVDTRPGTTTEDDVRSAEAKLGFTLPDELREFLVQFGHVKVELERTWNFYGIPEALDLTERYRQEFDRMTELRSEAPEDDSQSGYYPKRFIVLHDEGDFSDPASGMVYDADLDAFLVTDLRGVGREEAFQAGYWGYLLDELDGVMERISDPDDVLVSGGARDIAQKQKARDDGAKATTVDSAVARWKDAVARLYHVFEGYDFPERARFCFQGEGCEDCKRSNTAIASKPLRSIGYEELFHFAYYPHVTTDEAKEDFKHALPRIIELLDEIGWKGNPSVVIDHILRKVDGAALTPEEDRAVEDALLRRWESHLENPATDVSWLKAFLKAIATRRPDIAPYLDAWAARFADEAPREHAVACELQYDFERDGKYHGWPETAFAKLRSWFASNQRAMAVGAPVE